MTIDLIVERTDSETVVEISLDEWPETVARHPDLRIRLEPYVAINPRTGERIEAGVGDADVEFNRGGDDWVPLLRYFDGTLETRYVDRYDDPNNSERKKITQLARELGASIRVDVDDEPLGWS